MRISSWVLPHPTPTVFDDSKSRYRLRDHLTLKPHLGGENSGGHFFFSEVCPSCTWDWE